MKAAAVSLLLAIAAVAGCATAPQARLSPATGPAQAGLVDIRSLVTDIDLDIRYAGSNNFVGARVDGYEAPKCWLLDPAAQALARVERSLRKQGMRLRVFDCYRPARAVRHFVAWAHDLDDQATKPRHYPDLDKRDLLNGYISPRSGHSRGATVDLTLLQCDADGASCHALDMGTDFDFFDVRAHTDSPLATPEQHANRDRLRQAMQQAGFRNYPMEWWHFTLAPEPSPGVYFDVPVK